MTKIETVTIVYASPNVLLGMKKRRFGSGKYNGFGGKIKDGENLEECAFRETLEESGIRIQNPELIGRILFHFIDGEPDHLVYFFRAKTFGGELRESDEMISEWFHRDKIPYENMWPDDKYWLPLLLEGKKFIGEFLFDIERNIKSYTLKEVNSLD
ncbi:MAG: 8-oxo-dGTP diphosphatase [Candidatus Pacearchaeota archaeon]